MKIVKKRATKRIITLKKTKKQKNFVITNLQEQTQGKRIVFVYKIEKQNICTHVRIIH